MAINKVDLTVSQLINDLNEGLTWLKNSTTCIKQLLMEYVSVSFEEPTQNPNSISSNKDLI